MLRLPERAPSWPWSASLLKSAVSELQLASAAGVAVAAATAVCASTALWTRAERLLAGDGGVARMSDPAMIEEIKAAVTIPVMAKARIGHFVEAQILDALVGAAARHPQPTHPHTLSACAGRRLTSLTNLRC